MDDESRGRFPGVTSPNTTQVPDQYLDELLPLLTGGELKVLLYITRRTFGFKKSSDTISLSQMLSGIRTRDGRRLDRGCGLSKKTLLESIRSLRDQNIILTERRRSVERGDEPTCYRLNIIGHDQPRITGVTSASELHPHGDGFVAPVGQKLHQGGDGETAPGPWAENSPTQQTAAQDTGKQQTATSIFIPSNAAQQKPSVVENVPAMCVEGGPEGGRADTELASTGSDIDSTEPALLVETLTGEFSRDFDDQAHRAANVTQAVRLYRQSGLTEMQFTRRMYEARSITRDQVHRRRVTKGGPPIHKAMPYFFRVLEDVLALKDAATTPESTRTAFAGAASRIREARRGKHR